MADRVIHLPEVVVGGPKLPTAQNSLGTGRGSQAGDSLSTDPNDHGSDPQAESKKGPKPAAADPAPPIGLRDSHKGKVIAVAPDVKYVGARGQNPTPFITRAYTDDQPEHYSPDVRYEGDRAMRFNSDVSKTYGGQPGTGRGVKSDTYMDRTFPRTHSDNVFINGSPAMRKGDLFDHNGSSPDNANTVAKAQHPGPEDAKPAPEKTSWWGRQLNRAMGVVGVVGSAAEGIAGGALIVGGTAADATGVGALVGVPAQIGGGLAVLNAGDQGWASLKQVWTGEPQATYLQKGAAAATTALGGSQADVDRASAVTGLGQALVNPAAGFSKAGAVAEDASKLGGLSRDTNVGRDANAARDTDAASGAARDESAASKYNPPADGGPNEPAKGGDGDQPPVETDGSGGARVAKAKSKRLKYLGKTPGKNTRTGREVRERMREEGNLRENPDTGKDEFKADDGNWYPVDSRDTHMGHYPQDAVDYWNETGRQSGANSPEVRQWMLDPDNYRFEYGPENMSRGGSTTSRYLPPLK